ncbi:MAG: GlsB/YeaQ/YmgE family stress response membrane protein [Bacteroidales bacterium]|jgi:uncharacterized membrane protein YeaQ/YmgE (transglycosylase-associated protein family)|nr:GlsB/YeaQ/YmgE family stress response membrane protein [Bacteroidales bacterium]
MDYIVFIAVGMLTGWLAGFLYKSEYTVGINMLIGIAGSFLGGWLFKLLFGGLLNDGDITFIGSVIMAVIGSVLMLWLFSSMKKRKKYSSNFDE